MGEDAGDGGGGSDKGGTTSVPRGAGPERGKVRGICSRPGPGDTSRGCDACTRNTPQGEVLPWIPLGCGEPCRGSNQHRFESALMVAMTAAAMVAAVAMVGAVAMAAVVSAVAVVAVTAAVAAVLVAAP